MRERVHSESKYHRKLLEKCTQEDFTSKGIPLNNKSAEAKVVRFCPHIDMD